VRGMIRDQAIRLGLAFHDAMLAVKLEQLPDPAGLARDFGRRHGLDGRGRETLKEMLQRTFGSPLLERVRLARTAGGRIFRELPYVRLLGEPAGMVEEGKMDLLFEEGGAWILVDYKTDRLPAETQDCAAFFREQYGAQVHAYQTALREAGIRVSSTCLLLARTGETVEIPCLPIS
jgi:ATP-dependent exoDNAse (exonuclease V) beta subunit